MDLQELKAKALYEIRATWYQNQVPSLAYDLLGKVLRDYVCMKNNRRAAMEYPYANEEPPRFILRQVYVEGTPTNILFGDALFETSWFETLEKDILSVLDATDIIPNTLRVSLVPQYNRISRVELTIGVLQ